MRSLPLIMGKIFGSKSWSKIHKIVVSIEGALDSYPVLIPRCYSRTKLT